MVCSGALQSPGLPFGLSNSPKSAQQDIGIEAALRYIGTSNPLARYISFVALKNVPTGQYKWNSETGRISVVGSKATERPNLEKQGDLFDWAEAQSKLLRWVQATST